MMSLENLISENIDVTIEEISKINPEILNFSFEDMAKATGLTEKYTRFAINSLIQRFGPVNFLSTHPSDIYEKFLVAVYHDKLTTVNEALAIFSSEIKKPWKECILNLTPRLIYISLNVNENFKSNRSNGEQLLELILSGISYEGMNYISKFPPEKIEKSRNLIVPENIKQEWKKYLEQRSKFLGSLKSLGLTRPLVEEYCLNPKDFGF